MEELQPRRGPGRPPKEMSPEAAQKVAQMLHDQKALESNPNFGPQRRSERKPFGTMQQKLAYAKREGYHRHWFNDTPGRISRAEEAGYKHVENKEGKKVCEVVGVAEGGGALHAYLMEIPEEWYQEDMAAQQQEIDEREAAIRRSKVEGAGPEEQNKFYGTTSIKRG